MQEREGIRLKPQAKWGDESLTSEDYRLLEVVIAPNSSLINNTLKSSNFRENYGATVLAMRHRGELLHEKLSDTLLRAGDLLLLEIHRERLNSIKRSRDFIVASEKQTVEFRRGKVLLAILIVASVVLTASLNFAPIVVTSVTGAILMILLGCVTLEEAYQAIEWKIIFLLAGVLSLGVALDETGAARLISSQIVTSVGTFGLIALVSAFYLLTSVLTETFGEQNAFRVAFFNPG
jgi:di/tricarboxylate transporter